MLTDAQAFFLARTLLRRRLRFALITTPHGVVEQTYPPGVDSSGVLVDPQAYFFWLIQRSPGQPASDWVPVLTNSGIPEGYAPYVKPVWNDVYGLTQQVGADGVRGRLFLPTAQPDDLGYYSHAIDVLADGSTPGALVWAWVDKGGPPYVAVTPDGGQVPVEPPSGGTGGGLTEAEVQAMIDDSIAQALAGMTGVQIGDKIALRVNSGAIVGVTDGGPTTLEAPITFLAKEDIHAWETFTLERGE